MAAARTGGCGCSGGGGSCATASSSSARSIGSPAPQWIPWQPHRDGNRVDGDTSVARDTWHQRARRSLFEPSLPKEAARIDRSPARPGGAAPSDGARCFSGVTAPAPSCACTHSRTLVQGELGLERTNRPSVRAVQTPQAFSYALIRDAHERASAAGVVNLADDAAAAQWAGHVVHAIAGEAVNMKLTNPEDFRSAEAALAAQLCDIRTGLGYDVHAFGPGDHVWLGGLQIEHDAGLVGHSDADVLLHALTDAILGAIADGDIGSHFPPSDMQWKGAASDQFLRHAMELVAARGGLVAHLDATIICEAPKIGPHRDAIRANVAKICGLDLGRVAIKATTSEKLGFTGRREGIAVQAVATVRLPWGYW